MKNFSSLGLAVALAMTSMLAGCELYFGSHDGGEDHWTYCGSDGYYDCAGDNCQWVSPSCPSGGTTGSNGSGYQCDTATDCAAGCYCANGICEEAGFCSTDADCGTGYHCNVDRASCEPNPPEPTCIDDTGCDQGYTCQQGSCNATCTCTTDAGAVSGGYGWCDEVRGTCMTGTDPAGSCAGDVTCNIIAPTCAEGETALVKDGCWTGQCRAIAQCSEAPACSNLKHENDCLDRTSDCSAVYTGLGCHTPTGGVCHAGDTNCTCTSFVFNSCSTRTAKSAQVVQNSSGGFVDATTLF